MNKSLLFLIAICGARFICGCAAGNTTTPSPPVAAHFSVTPATLSPTAGTPFNFNVVAIDSSNNPVSSYSGAVHFKSTDAKAVLPADSTLTNGAGTFSATLKTSGGQIISATSSVSGSSISIAVSAGPASQLAISAPATVIATVPFSITVTALDGYNNTASSYAGTVQFTSSDAKSILPVNSKLPAGVGIFSVTTETVGTQTISGMDIANASIAGNSSAIAITPAPVLTIRSGSPPNGTVDAAYGGTRIKYELCDLGCYECTRTPFPGTCGYWPPCGIRPCILKVTVSGFTLNAIGGTPPYSWNAAGLPPGLGVLAEPGEVDISGTPPPGSNATYNSVQVTVHDSANPPAVVSANYSVVISNPPPPTVNVSPPIPAGAVNLPYSFTFTASSGQKPFQNWSETGAPPPGLLSLTSAGVLAGTPTTYGSYPITVSVQDSLGQTSASQNFTVSIYYHGFKAAGSMSAPRTQYTATFDGAKVLVAGGWIAGTGPLITAELFDPGTGTFSLTGSMGAARYGHTATWLLSTGKVLVAGGTDSNVTFAMAELYDPTSGTFAPLTATLQTARSGHTATLLSSGKVLILGGNDGSGNLLTSAELFDPATLSFTSTGSMKTARSAYTATVLNDGKVLVAGGFSNSGAPLATAELYDPVAGTFSPTGNMIAARAEHTATTWFSYGHQETMLAGGTDVNGNSLDTVEGFDEATGTFALATWKLAAPRTRHAAIHINSGPVLFIGGETVIGSQGLVLSSAESDGGGVGSLQIPRASPTATWMGGDSVVVIGGYNEQGYTATSELYK
jgi:hypothetical protein